MPEEVGMDDSRFDALSRAFAEKSGPSEPARFGRHGRTFARDGGAQEEMLDLSGPGR
jgi:hypothetical protein